MPKPRYRRRPQDPMCRKFLLTRGRTWFGLAVFSWAALAGAAARGQNAPGPDGRAPPPAPEAMNPPSLDEHPQAPYPARPLRDRVQGNLGPEAGVGRAGPAADERLT